MPKHTDCEFPVGSLVCFDPKKVVEGQRVSLNGPLTATSRAAMLRCVFRVTRSARPHGYFGDITAMGVGCILIEDPLGYFTNIGRHDSQVGNYFIPKMDLLTRYPIVAYTCSRRLTVKSTDKALG